MLSRDFKEFIESLNENDVRYLVVGGYAVALHGHPRYTKDLDVWVGSEEKNLSKLITALDDFGFGSLGFSVVDFEPDQIVQLGYPPNRIDLLVSLAGVDFDNCYKCRVQVQIDEVTADFIDLDVFERTRERRVELKILPTLRI